MSINVYTKVSKEFEKKIKSGEIVRTGVTLRDSKTGKIVGHLETVEKSNTERGKEIISQIAKTGIKVGGTVLEVTANTMGIAIKGVSNVAGSVINAGLGVVTVPMEGATLCSSILGNIQNVFIHKDVKATKKIATENLEISKETLSRVKNIESSLSGLQTCNWVTTGLSAVNLGVSVAGFVLVINKLGKIQKQLNNFDERFDALDKELIKLIQLTDENRILSIRQYHERFVSFYNQCITNLSFLSEPKFINNDALRDAKKVLDETHAFLLNSISLFKDGYADYISLDDIFTLLFTFTQLGIAYSTQFYKLIGYQNNSFTNQYSNLYKSVFCEQVFESLKKSYMINSSRLLTNQDYMDLYESFRCNIYNLAYSFKANEELLSSVKHEDFLKEQDLVNQLVSEDGNAIVLYDDWNNKT